MYPEVLTNRGTVIFPQLRAFDGFYLAGGTALALQIGHRISVDFDLFSQREIPPTLLPKVRRVFTDHSCLVSVNNPEELTIFVNEVKVTFLRYPYPVVLDLVIQDGLPLFSIKEIAATKAYTIGRRGSYKDYIDLYVVLKERHASLREVIEIAEKKYASEFHGRLFLEQLVYLEDIEDTEILFFKGRVAKDEVARFFVDEIRKSSI
jgi:hypothetical protein